MIRLNVLLTLLIAPSLSVAAEKWRLCELGTPAQEQAVRKIADAEWKGFSGAELVVHSLGAEPRPEDLVKALNASGDCHFIHLSWNRPFGKKDQPVRVALKRASELGRLVIGDADASAGPSAKTVLGGDPNVLLVGEKSSKDERLYTVVPGGSAVFAARLAKAYGSRPPALWRSFLTERKARSGGRPSLDDLFNK